MNEIIKIRFIEIDSGFHIQRKTLFGWNYIKYKFYFNTEFNYINYFSNNKSSLLKDVIKDFYGLNLDSVEIIEYPSLKKYKLNNEIS